jgi:hypothetical protein
MDILLESEVIKNRLKAIDPGYREAYAVFDRLVHFVNSNGISMLECFKKFDRDNSGALNKN